MRQEIVSKRRLLTVALALVAGLAAGPAIAQGGLNKDADEILRSMSTFLGGTKAFSVAADISNEVISKEGEKLQLNGYATVVFQRPAGFYFHRQGRFADVEVFFDGKTVSLFGKNRGIYVQREVAGTTDDAFNMITGNIGVDLPGVDLLVADPYAVLSSGITSSGYHGTDFVQGVECHHLSFREDEVDWQLWVKTGDEPLPMKYVITTKWLTGAPQYSVQMSNWNLKPTIAADRFTFAVPKGATKLETLAVDEAGELQRGEENK
jgi:hypothetical protein